MTLRDHAQAELRMLRSKDPGDPMYKLYEDVALMVIDRFNEDGHSGGSAPFAIGGIVHVLQKLLSYEPLSPLTGADDEWFDPEVGDDESAFLMNKRCSRVMKRKRDGRVIDLDSVIYRDPNGACFTRGGWDDCKVVAFPYVPTKRYVDVDDEGNELTRGVAQ